MVHRFQGRKNIRNRKLRGKKPRRQLVDGKNLFTANERRGKNYNSLSLF
jgi:hypothetical protein